MRFLYDVWEFLYGLTGAILTKIFKPDTVTWNANDAAVKREIEGYEENRS